MEYLVAIAFYAILAFVVVKIDKRNKRVNSKEAIEARYQEYRKAQGFLVRPHINELLDS